VSLLIVDLGRKSRQSNLDGFNITMFKARFVRSWKTWKSHGILKWSFPGLEKSWKKLKSSVMFIYAEFEIIKKKNSRKTLKI